MTLFIKNCEKKTTVCTVLLTSITHPLWSRTFWTMNEVFTLVTMNCRRVMLKEHDRWMSWSLNTFFTFKCGSHCFNHALLYCVSIKEALYGYHKGPRNTQRMLACSSLIHHENSLEVHNFDTSLQIWTDGGICELDIFLQMNYALISWSNLVFALLLLQLFVDKSYRQYPWTIMWCETM